MPATLTDWRTIQDEREKYAAYLCSREWAEKKEAVKERCKGFCERCKLLRQTAVHHLTYERKYKEQLEDLQAICQFCHEFTHAKSDLDPRNYRTTIRYLWICVARSVRPLPVEMIINGDSAASPAVVTGLMAARAVRSVFSLAGNARAELDDCTQDMIDKAIESVTGFYVPTDYMWPKMQSETHNKLHHYEALCELIGLEPCLRENEKSPETEDEEE